MDISYDVRMSDRVGDRGSFKMALGLIPIGEREALHAADYWHWAIPASPAYKLPARHARKREDCRG